MEVRGRGNGVVMSSIRSELTFGCNRGVDGFGEALPAATSFSLTLRVMCGRACASMTGSFETLAKAIKFTPIYAPTPDTSASFSSRARRRRSSIPSSNLSRTRAFPVVHSSSTRVVSSE